MIVSDFKELLNDLDIKNISTPSVIKTTRIRLEETLYQRECKLISGLSIQVQGFLTLKLFKPYKVTKLSYD